jgi:phage shock protein E
MKYFIPELVALTLVIMLGVTVYTCDPFAGKCFGQAVAEAESIRSLTPQEFKEAIDSGEYKLIDIRTVEEYYEARLAGAEQNDYYQTLLFNNYLDSLDKNEKYLIYCRTGNRTGDTLNIMRKKGFKNVAELDGGITAWAQNGLPFTR